MENNLALMLSSLLPVTKEEIQSWFMTPPSRDKGDLSFPCFRLAKQMKQNPVLIATNLVNQLNSMNLKIHGVEKVEASGGYLNFFYDRESFADDILGKNPTELLDIHKTDSTKPVLIEYSSPNIAKHFKLYHIRSTMIGQALVNIHKAMGFNTISMNHLGDWGTQFGKLMAAYKRWGNKSAVESDPINELVRLYVHFHNQTKAYPELEDEARNWFKKLEDGDSEALDLWKWFKDESLKVFDELYKKLNVTFDYTLGESFYSDKMNDVLLELQEKNLLEEDQGAKVVRLDEENMIPCMIQKSDGTSIYATRDIAAALYREENFHPGKMLYVVDNRQSLHFKQVFSVLSKMNREIAKNCEHVSFGVMKVNGEIGATRAGKGLLLEDVLNEAVKKAKETISTNQFSQVKDEEIDDVATKVGIASIVFNDLKHHPSHDIDFVLEDALSFEGKTGPYLQYTYARIQSLVDKHPGTLSLDANGLNANDKVVWDILFHFNQYSNALNEAIRKNDPSQVSRYLLELAQLFNRFYAKEKIITENKEETNAKILLSKKVSEYLKHGLSLLSIDTPNKL